MKQSFMTHLIEQSYSQFETPYYFSKISRNPNQPQQKNSRVVSKYLPRFRLECKESSFYNVYVMVRIYVSKQNVVNHMGLKITRGSNHTGLKTITPSSTSETFVSTSSPSQKWIVLVVQEKEPIYKLVIQLITVFFHRSPRKGFGHSFS